MRQLKLITPAVADILCSALDTEASSQFPRGHLRRTARIICRDAHARGYSVERMLIALKAELSMLMDAFHFPRGPERTKITDRFIAICIDEYFHIGNTEDDEYRGNGADAAAIDGRVWHE